MKISSSGFTLLEVILTVAIIGILTGLSVPVYRQLQLRNDVDVALNTAVQSLRRAQVLSQSVDGDVSWGLKVNSGSDITLFKGSSFALRDVSYDEVFELPSSITASGATEIVFTKFSGHPSTTGNMTLTSADNDTRQLTINSKGMIEY